MGGGGGVGLKVRGWSCGGVEEEWGVGGERVDTLIADTCD